MLPAPRIRLARAPIHAARIRPVAPAGSNRQLRVPLLGLVLALLGILLRAVTSVLAAVTGLPGSSPRRASTDLRSRPDRQAAAGRKHPLPPVRLHPSTRETSPPAPGTVLEAATGEPWGSSDSFRSAAMSPAWGEGHRNQPERSYEMNHVTLIGNLGDAPEIGETERTTFATFSLATHHSFTRKDGETTKRTDWHRVVAFNGLAKTLGRLSKGDEVAVHGRLQSQRWEDDQGKARVTVEVVASEVRFLRLKSREAEPS